ncbi:MAG: AAA domain-containing protein [Bacteroidota bacterium]
MKYELRYILSSPKGYDSLSLFEFCVNKLIQRMNDYRYPIDLENGDDAFKTHAQWANLIFGSGNDINKQYLSKVKTDYGIYFINEGSKYKWNFQRIFEEHPNFFLIEERVTRKVNIYDEMLTALEHEIIESKKEAQTNIYNVHDRIFKKDENTNIFGAKLDIEDDEEPKFVEGVPIKIRIGSHTFVSKVLDYDKIDCILYFKLKYDICKLYGRVTIQADASWIIEKVKERLELCLNDGNIDKLMLRFINQDITPKKIKINIDGIKPAIKSLDESQFSAYKNSINNDISIIWGPPGTGKSYTLASIIDTFYKKREKTLVTCIANVAVDSIILKLIDLLQKQNINIKQGEILRIGYTKDKKLLETECLFPDNDETKLIRNLLLLIDKKLINSKEGEDLEIKSLQQELRDELKDKVNRLIEKSIIVFSTVSKFFVDSQLNTKEFDNLIIDEASMVSIPYFIALGLKVKKRIIIAGDFRQLGPVVLSQSDVSMKWLHRDVFEFCGINPNNDIIEHKALMQLLIQRRFHELICNLINKPFYQGKLKSDPKFKNNDIIHVNPFKDKIIVYKELKKDNKTEYTKKGSRLNRNSASIIIDILDKYSKSKLNNSIGIITPYRGQVKLLEELVNTRNYSKRFKSLLKIGTIHAFQGSEFDLIIFDTVDSCDEKIGKLYRFETGKRLVNVALSRAKYKIIVCGDLDVFISGKGYNNVDLSVTKIFTNLKYYKV